MFRDKARRKFPRSYSCLVVISCLLQILPVPGAKSYPSEKSWNVNVVFHNNDEILCLNPIFCFHICICANARQTVHVIMRGCIEFMQLVINEHA